MIITGSSGNIGSALAQRVRKDYFVIGLDREKNDKVDFCAQCDLTSKASLELAVYKIKEQFDRHVAAVIHLAAYFDFTGEDSPAYEKVNEEGTQNLLEALEPLDVERFIYSGTMLVHEPGNPGERIDESTPINPKWAYPISKAKSEEIIREHRGNTPATFLHIAGLYDEETVVPTLSHQIARIYERDFKSHMFSGDLNAGQSFAHKEDILEAFAKVVEHRNELPEEHIILIGEAEAVGYQRLQDEIGKLIHGEKEWSTHVAPPIAAKVAAAAEEESEPIVPDDFDRGEKPFIRPFMIDMASDHYALNTEQARRLLDWEPKHSILKSLPKIIENLKKDPYAWYQKNGITAPRWVEKAEDKDINAEKLRVSHAGHVAALNRNFLWARFFNIFAGLWLLTSPAYLNYQSNGLIWSDIVSGALIFFFSFVALVPKYSLGRWLIAGVAVWVMFAPLVFWTPSAAVYLNSTLVGALVFGFSVLTRPPPGVTRVALESGPSRPPGWDLNPSSWLQRLPVIVLAVIGFFISRYLTAYQLGHIDGVWDPFFAGALPDAKNGTEEIITSSISEAWPVPDAGVGALTYMLEILTGIVGSTRRWRTMPWMVVLFGIMIVPLGAVSITFIIIQPLLLNTYCTLCLIAAVAMLVQIPYSLDELVATGDFLWRKYKKGEPVMRIFFTGDTDEGGEKEAEEDEFNRPFGLILNETFGGGLTAPWNILASAAIGIWLMFTPLTIGAEGGMAGANHLIGSIVVTLAVISFAETARPLRLLNIGFGVALLITPFAYGVSLYQIILGLAAGLALIALSIPKGKINCRYGAWSKVLV